MRAPRAVPAARTETHADLRPDPEVFARRRERFFARVKEGIALFFAAPEARFGHDTLYRYRPDPDLYYLTGFAEPEAVALLDADKKRFVLFVRPRNRERETWDGRRAGPRGAVKAFGADAAYPLAELDARLAELLRKTSVLHHAWGIHPEADAKVAALLARFRREAREPLRGPTAVLDPTDVVHDMRLLKEPFEIARMERAAAIAAEAHREAMALTAPGRYEYELAAAIERRFTEEGAAGPSYASIVASGENATILHYVENRRRIEAGDLVLVDAGCEYEGYASDITRTFPATGSFTRPQRRLYDVVLAAQEAAIAATRPGARFDAVQAAAHDVLVDGLLELGLVKGRKATILKKGLAQRFTLHRTSHWLGLDVHDRGRYVEVDGTPRVLAPGMVITVEPGLYVRVDEKRVAPEWLGLGVRIEDDVLVTESGPRVLTAAVPKRPAELAREVGRPAPRARAPRLAAFAAPRSGRLRSVGLGRRGRLREGDD